MTAGVITGVETRIRTQVRFENSNRSMAVSLERSKSDNKSAQYWNQGAIHALKSIEYCLFAFKAVRNAGAKVRFENSNRSMAISLRSKQSTRVAGVREYATLKQRCVHSNRSLAVSLAIKARGKGVQCWSKGAIRKFKSFRDPRCEKRKGDHAHAVATT
jgi:hypothetical protein